MTDDLDYDPALVAWLHTQLDADEQIAREASRRDDHITATGEHWQWVESENDRPTPPDPLTEEFVGENLGKFRVSLRSVEEYPTRSVGTLPHFVIPEAEEVPAICGVHIARWDPARVLAEVAAKRKLIDELIEFMEGDHAPWNADYLKLLAQPYAAREGYREEWRYEEVAR